MSGFGQTPTLRKTQSFSALDKAGQFGSQHVATSGNLDEGSRPQKDDAVDGKDGETTFARSQTANMLSKHLRVSRSEHTKDWNRARIQVYKYVHSPCFELTAGFLTFVNLFCLAYETNERAANPLAESPVWLDTLTICVLVCFTVELSLRIYALRGRFFSFWDMTDLFIVVSDWLFEILSAVLSKNMRIAALLRILRILRTFRIARAIRSMAIFRELYVMLHGFFSTLKAVFWASLLLGSMMLMWSIVLVEFIHPLNQDLAANGVYPGCERCGRAFAGIGASTITLIQHLVAGDSWGHITIPLMEYHPETAIIFMLILVTFNVGLLNLILSVIVDSASEVHKQDQGFQMQQRRERMEQLQNNLMHICKELDDNGDGEITQDELESSFDTITEFKETLEEMDIGKEELFSLFRMMDEDDSGQVSYAEFTDRLVKMKMTDMSMVIVFMKSHLREFEKRMIASVRDMTGSIKETSGSVALMRRQVTELFPGNHVEAPEKKKTNDADVQLQQINAEQTYCEAAREGEEGQPKSQTKLQEPAAQHTQLHSSLTEELDRLRERINMDLMNIAREVTSRVGVVSEEPTDKMVFKPRIGPGAGGLQSPEPTAPPAPEPGGGGSIFAPGCCTVERQQPPERLPAAPVFATMDPRMHRAIGAPPSYGQESRL